MQTLLKHRWALVVGLALVGAFGLFFATTRPAFAEDQFGCTYVYNSTKSTIARTDCSDDEDLVTPEVTFTKTGTNTYEFSETVKVYTVEQTCTLKITVSGDGKTGKLSGTFGSTSSTEGGALVSAHCENVDSSATSIAIGGVDSGGTSQTGTGGCTYAYNPKQTSILRSDCSDSSIMTPAATFKSTGSKTYEHSESFTTYGQPVKCVQKITIGSSETKGTLTGSIGATVTQGGASVQTCVSMGTSTITIGTTHEEYDDTSIDQAAYAATVRDAMDKFISKRCKGDTSGTCLQFYNANIPLCVAQVMPKIKDSDKQKNKKFIDLFSTCLSNKAAAGSLKKSDVAKALPDDIYDQMQTAASKAKEGKEDEDDDMTCEAAGGVFGWFLCAIIEGTAKASDGIFQHLIEPMLKTDPVQLDTSNPTFKAWSSFRILGDMFLVIALLVVVFGQTIGGGIIDAYTAKKVLPRLLLAAIGINLSIYIVAGAVDITNVIGNGIADLIQSPFSASNTFAIDISGFGTAAGDLGLATMIGAIAWAAWSGAAVIPWLLTFVLVPFLLVLLAILATVIIRRGLIILLILLAPVAFALYCLPNTEQYFRRWWDLFFKTLLVYPIIAALFAIANVMVVTLNFATLGSNAATKALTPILTIIVLIVPLFLIPFSFRLAGGVLGKLNDTLAAGRQRAHAAYKGRDNDPGSRQNQARKRLADASVLKRERVVGKIGGWQKSADRSTRMMGRNPLSRVVAWGLSTGDLEARRSQLTKEQAELRELKTNYGPDDSVRALFSRKDKDGVWRSTIDPTKTYSDRDRSNAMKLYGRNLVQGRAGLSSVQTALNYEMGKTGDDEEYARWLQEAPRVMDELGYNEGEVNGVMKGIGYNNAAKRLDLKHSKFTKNDDGTWTRTINHSTLARDAAENFGSYPISNFKTSPIEALRGAHDAAYGAVVAAENTQRTMAASGANQAAIDEAVDKVYVDAGFSGVDEQGNKISGRTLAETTLDDVRLTATTLDSRRRQGGLVEDADGNPIPSGGSGTGAAGRVDKAITDLVNHVNGYRPQGPRP